MTATGYELFNVGLACAASVVVGVIVLLLVRHLIKRGDPEQSMRGVLYDEKCYASLTHFQFFSWTVVFLFSILWVYLVRMQSYVLLPPPGLPTNTLILMGINTGSTVASKIVSKKKYKGLPTPKEKQSLWRMLYEKKDAPPDLSRVQLFVWTLVSILIYLVSLSMMLFGPSLLGFNPVPIGQLAIPDVDPSLVTLMGLSHTAFVVKKNYSDEVPNSVQQNLMD